MRPLEGPPIRLKPRFPRWFVVACDVAVLVIVVGGVVVITVAFWWPR